MDLGLWCSQGMVMCDWSWIVSNVWQECGTAEATQVYTWLQKFVGSHSKVTHCSINSVWKERFRWLKPILQFLVDAAAFHIFWSLFSQSLNDNLVTTLYPNHITSLSSPKSTQSPPCRRQSYRLCPSPVQVPADHYLARTNILSG